MVSEEKVRLARELFERLENNRRNTYSVDEAVRRLRILEVLSR